MGIAGTSRFVRTLGEALGQDAQTTEAWIEARLEAIRPRLSHLAGTFHGVKVAIFADTPLAAGLTTIMVELGVDVVLVGLRDKVLGGSAAFYDALSKNGVEVSEAMRVLGAPALRTVRSEILGLAKEGAVHAVIGSSIELDTLSWTRDTEVAMGRVTLLETGFPAKDHHTAVPVPSLGFEGVLYWAQRLLNGVMAPRMGLGSRG